MKHGRDLVVKVPAGDFANCGEELHCGRDDPYPDIPVFQDLPDHDSIRYIEALDAQAAKVGAQGGDLAAFPLSVVGALNPARGLAVVMNELFKAWLYWSGVGAGIVGMGGDKERQQQAAARAVASSSEATPYAGGEYAQDIGRPSVGGGSFRGGFPRYGGDVPEQQRRGNSFAGSVGGGARVGGGGSFRGGSSTGPPPAAPDGRRAYSGRFEVPQNGGGVPQRSATGTSRLFGGGSRGNSLTGRG